MSPRTRLVLHVLPAMALPLLVFGASTVGNVESFENWLLGHAELSTRILPLVSAVVIALAIMLHHLAGSTDRSTLKAIVGGALIGFLAAVVGNMLSLASPLLGMTLTIAGALGGWAFLPRP